MCLCRERGGGIFMGYYLVIFLVVYSVRIPYLYYLSISCLLTYYLYSNCLRAVWMLRFYPKSLCAICAACARAVAATSIIIFVVFEFLLL